MARLGGPEGVVKPAVMEPMRAMAAEAMGFCCAGCEVGRGVEWGLTFKGIGGWVLFVRTHSIYQCSSSTGCLYKSGQTQ